MVRTFLLLVVGAILPGAALGQAFTLDAEPAISVAYAHEVTLRCRVAGRQPDEVVAHLAGFAVTLRPEGEGVWQGTLALAPVPLPPATYSVVYQAGEASRFIQHLTLEPPSDGTTPWLPGGRATGGPLPITGLGADTVEYLEAVPITVRIEGGRPARFEAWIAGFSTGLVHQGDGIYRGEVALAPPLPPATYTVRVEAEAQDGSLTTFERALSLAPPADGGTPWLLPQAPTVWEAGPLDDAAVPGEPAEGCAAAGTHPPGGLGWLLLALVGLGRWRRRWALAALLGAASAGCDGDGGPEARRVGSGEALVEVLDEGSGFANEAPLWPLTLGATLTKTGTNAAAAQVTDAWPLPGGGQGFTLRWRLTAVNFPMDWHALAQTPDGLYVLASAAGGQLHRPLLVLPSTVRLGMRWRSWARPHDAARLDLGELGTLDRTGGYEFKVVRVVRENGAGSPRVTRRRWEIEWKGPRNPTGTGQGDYPREPARGTLVFLEGIGPIGDVAFPALGFGQYGLRLPDSRLSDGIRLLPAPAPAEAAAAPAVRLRPIPTPEALSSVWIRQLGVLDLDDGHGPWIRVDGNEAGLSYPSVFPGQAGGVGGNANLWVPSPTSHCFAFEGGRLISGQALGVLAEGETCVAAAGAVVAEAGDAVFDTPFLDYFGRPLPQAEFGPRDARVSTQARGVLPGRGGAAPTLLARRNDGWHLLPWQAFEWSNRYDLDALAPVAAVDGTALDALDALGEPGQLLSQPVGDGAVGLLVRNTSRVGDATAWGYARLDPDGVIRDAVRYGEVGFEAAFRADAAGREVWQVDRAGRVWEWRLTATGLERRVRALLRLPGGQAPLAAVRLDAERLLVVTAGPEPEGVPGATARLECENRLGYCFERPAPAPPRLWTAALPAPAGAGPWAPPAPLLGVTVSADASGLRICGAHAGAPARLSVVAAQGVVEGEAEGEGRCVALSAAQLAGVGPVWSAEGALPGTGPFTLVRLTTPLWPAASP